MTLSTPNPFAYLGREPSGPRSNPGLSPRRGRSTVYPNVAHLQLGLDSSTIGQGRDTFGGSFRTPSARHGEAGKRGARPHIGHTTGDRSLTVATANQGRGSERTVAPPRRMRHGPDPAWRTDRSPAQRRLWNLHEGRLYYPAEPCVQRTLQIRRRRPRFHLKKSSWARCRGSSTILSAASSGAGRGVSRFAACTCSGRALRSANG